MAAYPPFVQLLGPQQASTGSARGRLREVQGSPFAVSAAWKRSNSSSDEYVLRSKKVSKICDSAVRCEKHVAEQSGKQNVWQYCLVSKHVTVLQSVSSM